MDSYISKQDGAQETWRSSLHEVLGAFAPVRDWYEGEGDRPLHEMVADAVADLQSDRADCLRMSNALKIIAADAAAVRDEWLAEQPEGIRLVIANIRKHAASNSAMNETHENSKQKP